MANARITLVEGSGFGEGEWAGLEKQVLVANTVLDAVIDLATGTVTPDGEISANSIVPSRRGDEWRAIVVPQTVAAGTTMFSITLDGIPYKFSKGEAFTYIAGKMNNFGIKVDKRVATGDYTLTLISESITPWENDLVSHDAVAKEYVVVNSTPGGLKDAITKAGKDYTKVRNLKVTGEIDLRDFNFMQVDMTKLQALNMKEARIKAYEEGGLDDQIPAGAFDGCTQLTTVVFPEVLKSIGYAAFASCQLTGTLIIPDGVEDIQDNAFQDCSNLTGNLSLPSTLRSIGDQAFEGCSFTCELILPENLEKIGSGAFTNCSGLYGNLNLPENLKTIGSGAFMGCVNFRGSLEIPQGVTEIQSSTFANCGFNGQLRLHDGITLIGNSAFSNCRFKGELYLPKNLVNVAAWTFFNCDFSGELILPKDLVTIGDHAFGDNKRLTGVLEFGEGVMSIGENAFSYCSGLEGLVFPSSLENMRNGAFAYCYGVGSIVCKGTIPAHISQDVFQGVAKDNFTLEVPESAVAEYQTAVGWNEFRRIASHHELVCRPSSVCALSTERKQDLVLNAEGDWELVSKPDWCDLSQTSGNKKSEITLTIKAASATESREGDIVFRLKDKEYMHTCHVAQYGYEYGEDEFLALQKATKGNNGGINIVILGDGYDAKEISSGAYLTDMQQEIEYFFAVEPYATYRDYFNVYTAFPVSTETGVGTVNTICKNRFGTTFTGAGLECDYEELTDYVTKAPTVAKDNLDQTLTILVPNTTDYNGGCNIWQTGFAIAFCPKSVDDYPFDSRGIIQHEAGGHGFGKLADEYIETNGFISGPWLLEVMSGKSMGWYDNIELTGKMHEVGWSHLIFDPRYQNIVDIYEGGFRFSRGVFRSENNSCMNNNIPYYSTISRESIVKRIKRYAGEDFDFEEFVSLDKREAATASRATNIVPSLEGNHSLPPVIHKGSPLSGRNRAKKLNK